MFFLELLLKHGIINNEQYNVKLQMQDEILYSKRSIEINESMMETNYYRDIEDFN